MLLAFGCSHRIFIRENSKSHCFCYKFAHFGDNLLNENLTFQSHSILILQLVERFVKSCKIYKRIKLLNFFGDLNMYFILV